VIHFLPSSPLSLLTTWIVTGIVVLDGNAIAEGAILNHAARTTTRPSYNTTKKKIRKHNPQKKRKRIKCLHFVVILHWTCCHQKCSDGKEEQVLHWCQKTPNDSYQSQHQSFQSNFHHLQ
jgi:hypothetical protein